MKIGMGDLSGEGVLTGLYGMFLWSVARGMQQGMKLLGIDIIKIPCSVSGKYKNFHACCDIIIRS